MIKRLIIILLSVLSLSLLLEGCGSTGVSSVKNQVSPAQTTKAGTVDSSQSDVIDVWTASTEWEDKIKEFEEKYKGKKVRIKTFNYESSNNAYAKALASGTGPDVLEITSNECFGQYVVNGVLEDLLKDPYNAGKYEKDFSKDVWESNMSIDNKSILGITYFTTPLLTYYRADIMQQNGFPSNPEEFGKFIESSDNLISIAKKLKAKNQYILQWVTDITDLLGTSIGFFDKDLNYLRNNELITKGFIFAGKARKGAFAAEKSIWDDSGKQAIQSSELVMLIGADMVSPNYLESYAPDQKGNWRVTKPPFGVSACALDSKLCINAESKNKELAWKFIESVIANPSKVPNTIPGYMPARKNISSMAHKNEFFGGQVLLPLCEDQVDKMKHYKSTPLDDKVIELYRKQFYDGKYINMEPSKATAEMAKDIETAVAEEKQALLKQIKK